MGGTSMVNPPEKASTTIQTLAPEILTEIFLQCLCICDYECWIRDRSQPPLLFGRVCSRWRTVSISSRDLWSSFSILGVQVSKRDCKKDLEATKEWISRSAPRPLSININYDWQYRSQEFPRLLELVASQSWRWKELEIKNLPAELDSLILAPFRTGHLPHLENFFSKVKGLQNEDVVHLLALSSVPQLQVFCHLDGSAVHIGFGSRIHHIKSLEIVHKIGAEIPGLSLEDFVACLTHCPQLEELTLSITEISTKPPQEIPFSIELPYLHDLSLTVFTGIDPGYVFDILFLPALTYLDLFMVQFDDDYTDWPHLRSMLTRSRPKLRELSLAVPMTDATLVESLSYIPLLESLTFDGVTESSDTLLISLTMDTNEPSRSLCPSLKTVDFISPSFSSNALIAMILSRWQGANLNGAASTSGIVLETVCCRSFSFDRILANPDIVECVGDGLKLVNKFE